MMTKLLTSLGIAVSVGLASFGVTLASRYGRWRVFGLWWLGSALFYGLVALGLLLTSKMGDGSRDDSPIFISLIILDLMQLFFFHLFFLLSFKKIKETNRIATQGEKTEN